MIKFNNLIDKIFLVALTIPLILLVIALSYALISDYNYEPNYIYYGEINEYVAYYPKAFSSAESCLIEIDGVRQIFESYLCSEMKKGDILYIDTREYWLWPFINYKLESTKSEVSLN